MKGKGSLITLVVCLMIIIYGAFINSTCYLVSFSGRHEVYLKSNSSNAQTVCVEADCVKRYISKSGEAVLILNDVSIEEILKEFCASLSFFEETEEGVSYYAYSRKIKYRKILNGKVINLHIFKGKNGTKIGSPLIYGSF